MISFKSALLVIYNIKDGKYSSSLCKLYLIILFSIDFFSNHLANDIDTLGIDIRVRNSNLLEVYCRIKYYENIEYASSRNDLGRILKIIFTSSPVCNSHLSLKCLKLLSVDYIQVFSQVFMY